MIITIDTIILTSCMRIIFTTLLFKGVIANQMDSIHWQVNFRILWSGRFLASAGLTGISPFIPFYMESLGAGDERSVLTWSGFALAAPAVSYALTTPLWGKVSDRWSRKWMVVRALFGLALSMLLMGIAATPFQFFLFRLCQGAFGGISDASSAFIGADAPKNQQGYALGRLENASALGLLVGPFLGGMLVQVWGCRPLLLIMAAATGVCAILASFLLTETKNVAHSASKKDGIREAFFALYENRTIRNFILAGILVKMADFATFAVFTPYVKQMISTPETAAVWVGVLLAATYLGELTGSPWWGRKNDHNRIESNFMWAALLCAICMLVQTVTMPLHLLFLVRFLQGFFYSALLQSVMLVVIRASDADNRGVRIGATNSLLMGGQLLGPFIGSFLGVRIGLAWVFFTMGSVLILASVVIWYHVIVRKERKEIVL